MASRPIRSGDGASRGRSERVLAIFLTRNGRRLRIPIMPTPADAEPRRWESRHYGEGSMIMETRTKPTPASGVGRNLVICCDGTNNKFGSENTNVVRLVQVLNRDPERQRLYYDPGVGTLPEPGWLTSIGKRASEIL